MGTIFVEGLGNIEIEGDVPTKGEQQAIIKSLEKPEAPSIDIDNQYLDNIPDPTKGADVEQDLATDTIIPELIDPDLAKLDKPKGLEKIGLDRPAFEAAGAVFGAVPGTYLGPAGTVAGGTLGAMGTGQLYDVLQAAITDEPTDFGTQIGRAKSDFQREALLQSFFAKIPGLGTKIRGLVYGKPNKELYQNAKKINFPLSLSDSGNAIGKGYGRVIGVFPIAGSPIKKAGSQKAAFLNKQVDDTLNTFGPNVHLSKLGIDMTKASKSTFDDFRRVSGFFYDDFYKAVDKIGNTPVISTKNYKAALDKYVKLVDGGKIKGVTSPRKDKIYRYSKQTSKKIPEYINATQYKSLIEDIKFYANLAKKTEGFDIKILTGFKSSLERDLRLLTKSDYQENLLKNVYPLTKSKRKSLEPNILSDIATKLKFADKVYANGLQNSIIKEIAKKEGKKKVKDLVPIPGKKTFDSPTAGLFKRVDKNIFGAGFQKPGSLNADELGEALLKRSASPKYFKDLKSLVGDKQFNRFVRGKINKAYESSLIQPGKNQVGLVFDPYKFEKNLGLTTEAGRDILEEMLKGSKLKIEKLDAFFDIAKNHAGLKIPDVSSFVARRAVLGGTKSLVGGALMTVGVTANPFLGASLIYLSRRTSSILADPKVLDDVMTVLDPNSTASQIKVTSLKLIDGLISDSKNDIEKNELSLYREFIETAPLNEIKKGIDDTLNSSQEFLNIDRVPDKEKPIAPNTNTGSLPSNNIPLAQTPIVNAGALLQPNGIAGTTVAQTGLTPTEQALLSPEEQGIRLRQRGMTRA